jgi:mono/diheme cytochrome c family protein
MNLRKSLILLAILLVSFAFTACSGNAGSDPLVVQGEKLFTANCLSCHPIDPGQPRVGPDLVGLGPRLQASGQDAAAILGESIREPGKVLSTGYQDLMPSADLLGLNMEDIEALTAYLISLKG